jgi:hypothetical protein
VIDETREKWKRAYTGTTDDGFVLPIEEVIPGAIVNGMALGYFSAYPGLDPESCWRFRWEDFNPEKDHLRLACQELLNSYGSIMIPLDIMDPSTPCTVKAGILQKIKKALNQ